MTDLTSELTALLAAVRDALTLPPATIVGEGVRDRLMEQRASDVEIIVKAVLEGQNVASCAKQLEGWTAERPVTYTIYEPKQEKPDPSPNLTALLATAQPLLPSAEDDPVAMYFGPNLQELADPIGADGRCGAAHVDDPDPCGGPVVVMVLDQDKAGARGCEHHAARLLASLDGASVYGLPDAPMGTAVRVFKAAREIEPFVWLQ